MSQSRGRAQSRGQSREQSQVRAQLRKSRLGDAYDELDLIRDTDLPVGCTSTKIDQDHDDDHDFDLAMNDDDGDADIAETSFHDPSAPEERSLVHRITGQREPRVLLRLIVQDDGIVAIPLVRPKDEARIEAIDELTETVRLVFESARRLLSDEQWHQLVGSAPATIAARVYLLSLVQMKFGESVTTKGGGPFKLSDREFSRYASKFMLLPDGMPVTLRLLFKDGRGSAKKDGTSLWDLPDSMLLNAVRATLAREAIAGVAEEDANLAFEIESSLKEMMGFDVLSKPSTQNEVRRIREKLKKHGFFEELPNRLTRQHTYDAARTNPGEILR